MFSAKMAPKSILFALLVIFITSRVSAKKCYVCISLLDEECRTNPRQEKFEFNCGPSNATVFAALRLNSNQFNDEDIVSNESESRAAIFQCITSTHTNLTNGELSLARGCVPTFFRDESLKVLSLVAATVQTDTIRRCDSELCNSY